MFVSDLVRAVQTAELAIQHGDPHSQGLHFAATSVRSLWLDRAQQAH